MIRQTARRASKFNPPDALHLNTVNKRIVRTVERILFTCPFIMYVKGNLQWFIQGFDINLLSIPLRPNSLNYPAGFKDTLAKKSK